MKTAKFLQWNILYYEDPDKTAELIDQLDPDIAVLQEPIQDSRRDFDTTKYLTKKTALNNYFFQVANVYHSHQQKETQGNAVMSKFPIVSSKAIYLSKPKDKTFNDSLDSKIYLEVVLDLNNQPVTVGTTHLSYENNLAITDQKQMEVDKLTKIFNKKEQQYIFGGDLNLNPDSTAYQQLTTKLINAGPDLDQKTWPTRYFNYHGYEEPEMSHRPDYVLVTSDVEVIKAEVIQTKYSDHLPLLIEFQI